MTLEHFQNREDAIAAFDHLWDAPAPWILAFTGFSGQGKSTLLNWFEAYRCQVHNMPYALIGLGEYAAQTRAAFQALLESEATTLPRYLPAVDLNRYREARRRAIDQLNQRHLALSLRQEMSGSAGGSQSVMANLAEAFREMESQTDEVVLDAWLDCFAALGSQERIVLLLDNYDSFQDSVAVEELQRFWQILARAYSRVPGLRVVVACREQLRHQNKLRAFHNGLVRDGLKPLNFADSNALLQSMGVTDLYYQQAVFKRLARGHPLLTHMAAQAWLEAGGKLTATDVPYLNTHEEAVRWVQGRILDRLQGALKEAVRWGALLRQFNAESLAAILEQPLSPDEFRTLIDSAFIIRPRHAAHAWACHDLVRRVQIAYLRQERPSAFHACHQKARTYFLAQGDSLESLYHHFFTNLTVAFAEWQDAESQAAFSLDNSWSALIEIGRSPEIELSPDQEAEVLYRAGKRHLYQAKEKSESRELDAALENYTQALKLFEEIGSLSGQTKVLRDISEVHQVRKNFNLNQDSYS